MSEPCWNCNGTGRFTLVVRDFVEGDGTPEPVELDCPFCTFCHDDDGSDA